MSTLLAWGICLGIIGLILMAIFAQVWDDAKEIAREEQKKKDWREVNYWKQKALRPVARIQVIDSYGGGEIYIQEDLRNER